MASPEPSGFHHRTYTHHEQQQQQPPTQPLSGVLHDLYSERALHYPEQPHPHYPPPHSHPHPHEAEQPLDLTVSRSPRPSSAGPMISSSDGGGPKRPRLEEPSRAPMPPAPMGRPDHSGMCMVKGCGCQNTMPMHSHHPHQFRHRHSPYPQYSSSGRRSPGGLGGDLPLHPLPYSLPPHPPTASSPAMMPEGRSSPYFPAPQDRHCRSPYRSGLMVPTSLSPYSSEMLRQGPSPSAVLLCPPHSTASPHSVSPRPRDNSPRPSNQTSPRARDISPRPFYRPFEDTTRPSSDLSHTATVSSSSSGMITSADRYRHTSEDDLTASSSLLLLSSTSSMSRSSSSAPAQHTRSSSWTDYRREEPSPRPMPMEADDLGDTKPSQSDAERSNSTYYELPAHHSAPVPPHSKHFSQNAPTPGEDMCDSDSRSSSYQSEECRRLSPAQDRAVASSRPSCDLSSSPAPPPPGHSEGQDQDKKPESRFMNIVGTTPLSIARAERVKHQQKVSKERMKEIMDRHKNQDGNDSEGGSEQNSSGQPSPRSSDGSDGCHDPSEPGLKMTVMDYLISKVLVEHIDKPFKACNTEIKEIYSGAKKGRLTLVDLIELQVEASLKA